MPNKRSKSESPNQHAKNDSKKIKHDKTDLTVDDQLPQEPCKYGSKCYRKNEDHLKQFSHSTCIQVKDESLPVNYYYLSKVFGLSKEINNQKYSIGIKEILSKNEDDFVQSAQFNYCFDIHWLMDQYPRKNQNKPLFLIHGFDGASEAELKSKAHAYSQIKLIRAKLSIPFGTHHTKMMLLLYKNGLRVVIHTANLIEQDWHQKTQGIWISELFPKCDDQSLKNSDSKTNFKKDLLNYVDSYKDPHLKEWQNILKSHDMSSANVFLVSSYPGRFMANKNMVGHLRLRSILNEHFDIDDDSKANIISQFSSIGSLGMNETSWLINELHTSFIASKSSDSKTLDKMNNLEKILIYPSVENVRSSFEGYMGGTSLPYSVRVADKQKYLDKFLYQWKSDKLKRTQAIPHIKTYGRFSTDFKKLFWFLLTSANLSKAAWGVLEKNNTQLMIRSYEMGVLFLPSFLQNEKKNYFQVDRDFMLPYDVPPSKYEANDTPWIYDISYTNKEDTHERIWRIK